MIYLSNGHRFEYMVASGALAFDGQGWLWEQLMVLLGYIDPSLFTTVLKTLTRNPRQGNLKWYKPWECVSLIKGGSVNKVGLTNPGIDWWRSKISPCIDFQQFPIIASIFGDQEELVEMTQMLNSFELKGVEVNPSCPNTGHALEATERVIDCVKAVSLKSRHPTIAKLSVDQDYLSIERGLRGFAQAISLNSVPWKTVFFDGQRSPLWRLEQKIGGGGGGVSGKPAQRHNWAAVAKLAMYGEIPVIGPSVMEFEDMLSVRTLGAKAVSFGAIHLPSYPFWRQPWTVFTNPCKPTSFVRKELYDHRRR